MEIHNPGNTFKIEKIFAVISQDENGNEGVIGVKINDQWIPFIGADETRIQDYEKMVPEIKANYPGKIKLIEFNTRKDLKEY